MIAHELTQEQHDQLVGQLWSPDQYFNPTADANGILFISVQEVQGYTGSIPWVSQLPEVEITPVRPPIETN